MFLVGVVVPFMKGSYREVCFLGTKSGMSSPLQNLIFLDAPVEVVQQRYYLAKIPFFHNRSLFSSSRLREMVNPPNVLIDRREGSTQSMPGITARGYLTLN